MLGFWIRQIQAGERLGRNQVELELREIAVREAATRTERSLRAEIEAGVEAALTYLESLDDGGLERVLPYSHRGQEGEITVGEAIERFVVVHLEEHVKQLSELT